MTSVYLLEEDLLVSVAVATVVAVVVAIAGIDVHEPGLEKMMGLCSFRNPIARIMVGHDEEESTELFILSSWLLVLLISIPLDELHGVISVRSVEFAAEEFAFEVEFDSAVKFEKEVLSPPVY
jgi:hypothetical protein